MPRTSHELAHDTEMRAWTGLVTNLLVLPGLGSLLVGRKVGWLQAALALSGFLLTLEWMLLFLGAWVSEGSFPLDAVPDMRPGLVGLVFFAIAWLWSLVSSLDAIRRARGR